MGGRRLFVRGSKSWRVLEAEAGRNGVASGWREGGCFPVGGSDEGPEEESGSRHGCGGDGEALGPLVAGILEP